LKLYERILYVLVGSGLLYGAFCFLVLLEAIIIAQFYPSAWLRFSMFYVVAIKPIFDYGFVNGAIIGMIIITIYGIWLVIKELFVPVFRKRNETDSV